MSKTLYILTPCMNAVDTIDRTIMSVVAQAGDFKIRYHIQDAGSTDGTYERILWWKARIEASDFPVQCNGIEFSCVREADAGMYDGLIKGFKCLSMRSDDFMTWINADDVLMTGALALVAQVATQFKAGEVSWIGGGCAIIRDDHLTVSFDRKVPTEAIRRGLCDGVHWDFLQQEGTFFRKWLWDAALPEQTIGTLKLAGDWNLWRVFAHKASFVQFAPSLGGFRRREGQLFAAQRENYMGEIAALVSLNERKAQLKALGAKGELKRRRLIANSQGRPLVVSEEVVDRQLASRYQNVFGQAMPAPLRDMPEKRIYEGRPEVDDVRMAAPGALWRSGNLYAFDQEWQYPAITEQHAFHQIRDTVTVPSGIAYVAYPWATLIDKLQGRAKTADAYLETFRQFCHSLPRHLPKVTVCQHILMRNYMHLFEEAGIEDVFWAHATHADVAAQATANIRIHAFPLYPVQVTQALPDTDAVRPYLFSFIGAKSNKWYMTDVRAWIIDELAADPRGLVIGRDSWHYNKVVYDHQIHSRLKEGEDASALVDQSASEEFTSSLSKSVFSLCPSGSGPNSIRLWESIGAGSIPVILSDQHALPGDPGLWQAAVVFCEESQAAVKALPDRLAAIASDPERLRQMRHALRQLWLLYGPQSFVYDVQLFLQQKASVFTPAPRRAEAAFSGAAQFIRDVAARDPLSETDAVVLLRACASELLLNRGVLRHLAADTAVGKAVQRARKSLPARHEVIQHFDRVVAHAEAPTTLKAPSVNRGAVPVVCLFGRHSHRTPLSYKPFLRHIGERLKFSDEPARSDLILSGFNIDIRENAASLAQAIKAKPSVKIAIISEEPLWDTIWSGGFKERDRTYKGDDLETDYLFLNHQTSSIFHFDKIPYFLLTADHFPTRYANLLRLQAKRTPAELLAHWQAATVDVAFFAEMRESPNYAQNYADVDMYGLSVFRTDIAKQVNHTQVLRVGAGWSERTQRQKLPDWHLDKMVLLGNRSRIVSAYENTHQRHYISEKIFDALAVGGIPTYHASRHHRIFELVPNPVMLNSFGLSAEAAARQVEAFVPDIQYAEIYLKALQDLQRKFNDYAIIAAERQRVADSVLDEIRRYL